MSERVFLCCSVSVDARGAGLPAPRNSPASTSISSRERRDYRQSHSMTVFPTVSRGSNSSFPHFHSKPFYTPRHHLSPIFTFFIKMPGDCKIQSTLGRVEPGFNLNISSAPATLEILTSSRGFHGLAQGRKTPTCRVSKPKQTRDPFAADY